MQYMKALNILQHPYQKEFPMQAPDKARDTLTHSLLASKLKCLMTL